MYCGGCVYPSSIKTKNKQVHARAWGEKRSLPGAIFRSSPAVARTSSRGIAPLSRPPTISKMAAAVATRLSIVDIAHRTLVTGLFGLTLWGTYGIYALHNERLRLGLLAQAEHDLAESLLTNPDIARAFSDDPPTAPKV